MVFSTSLNMMIVTLLILFEIAYVSSTASYTHCTCYEYQAFCKNRLSTWDGAKLLCKSLGGWLATIDTESTFQQIIQTINDAGMNTTACHKSGFWIGLYDPTPTGTGHTGDSLVWVHDMCESYQKWASNQPDDATGKNPLGQNCVQLWFRNNGDMDDYYCFKKKGYICQIPRSCTCTINSVTSS
ncbi:C-type lectin domain family 19 member A-like [Saccoglossus kowalevskii]